MSLPGRCLPGQWARRCLLPAALLAVASALVAPLPASAETSREADHRANAILRQVNQIQSQVDRAEADYQAAITSIADAVSHGISADEYATETGQEASAQRDVAGARVRALYRNGGPLALYASVLSSGDVSQALTRLDVARRIVGRSSEAAREAAASHAVDVLSADTARTRALAEVRATRSVLDRYAALTALLDKQQSLLSQARGRVQTVRAIEAAQARIRAARASSEASGSSLARRANPMPGSAGYFALYHSAAPTCPGLSWSVLAAIGQVESGHGRNPGVSYAGAQGPMQFMPKTFAHYGVDGDGDGRIEIQSAADSIFTAAHYLCANGAGKGPDKLYFAIFRYNHADWYVQLVLNLATKYAARDGA